MATTIAKYITSMLVRDVILIIVVIAGVVSYFYNPLASEAIKYLQTLAGGIIGYYIGLKEVPLASAFKKDA